MNLNNFNIQDYIDSGFVKQKNYYNSKFFNGSDNEVRFKRNLLIQPKDWKYRTKEIIYNLNSQNYRTSEWEDIDWADSVVALGCSNVFGVGLAEDETFCFKLQKMLKRPVINLGYGGCSNDLIVNNCALLINNFKTPKIIIIGWTAMSRLTYYENKEIESINKNNMSKNLYLLINKENFTISENICAHNYFMLETVKAILKDRCRLLFFSLFKETAEVFKCKYFDNKFSYVARDLMHPGEEINDNIAKYLYNEITNNNNFFIKNSFL